MRRQTRIITLILLSLAGCMYAQTADQLIEKYKSFPGAEYSDMTEENLKEYKKDSIDYVRNGIDVNKIIKSFKKVEQVGLELNPSQSETLTEDIKSLKGFEPFVVLNDNNEDTESDENIFSNFKSILKGDTDLFHNLQMYVRTERDDITESVIKINFLTKTYISHAVFRISMDDMKKMMALNMMQIDGTDDDDDGNDDSEEIDRKNLAVIINGTLYPELHSEKEAMDYLGSRGVAMESCSCHYYMGRQAVKEEFPDLNITGNCALHVEYSTPEK